MVHVNNEALNEAMNGSSTDFDSNSHDYYWVNTFTKSKGATVEECLAEDSVDLDDFSFVNDMHCSRVCISRFDRA